MCRRWLALLACAWSLLEGRAAPAQTSECLEEAIAQIKSVQGERVQIWRASTGTWSAAKLDTLICAGDYIYVGERSRAAAQMRKVETVVSFDENTTILLGGTPQTKSLLMEILEGAVNFLSRVPQPMDIHTPFVNAGVEGTEFEVRVVPDRQRSDRRQRPAAGAATVSVFEGKVRAANASGSVELASGQTVEARVCPPQPRSNGPPECAAPSVVLPLRIYVTPPDAVQWVLYYPPIHAEPGRATTPALVRASRLISVGQIDEAAAILASVPDSSPAAGEKYALLTVIAVARNERKRALDLGARAVKLAPNSSSARIALSYAQQANFELEAARDTLERAVAVNPDDALAWARLAEIWLSLGYRDRALEAAEKAAKLAPKLSRTQTVLGFAALAQIELREAISAFSRAIALDSADPLPRLGFGLARIRKGELVLGRQEIEIAAALDPRNSLIRSYLGKAYFEEKRDPLDGIQFDLAKKYDELDPTPWLYDAIRKETENRPVEALHDIQKSIELNDNRAVYRSRLLLDEDAAVRSTSLGRIYEDLGFEQTAVVEGTKSLGYDPANYSAHRFLSDSYAALPRYEIARSSELLQSQLLQPLNANPVQPQIAEANLNILTGIGPARVAFNEFTPLFQRDGLQFNASGIVGTQDTYSDEAVLSGIAGRTAFSLGQFHYQTEGFRPNNDVRHDIYDAFGQVAITDDLDVQIEYRRRETEQGDIGLRFDPDVFFDTFRRKIDEQAPRIGIHYSPAPGNDLIASFIYTDREESFHQEIIPGATQFDTLETKGYDAQAQYLFQSAPWTVTAGAGMYSVDLDLHDIITTAGPCPFDSCDTTISTTVKYHDAYVYTNLNWPDSATWTLGLSYDSLQDDVTSLDVDEVNPKAGLQWNLTEGLRLRLAYFETLKRNLSVDRTLEPTQVAGFNQFFDDFNGTRAKRYGVGLDWQISDELFTGIEASRRELKVPIIGGLSDTQDEELYRAYLYWALANDWAATAEFSFEGFDRSDFIAGLTGLPNNVETFAVPFSVGYFGSTGIFDGVFASLGATFVHQRLDFPADLGVEPEKGDFVVVDGVIGYRFPDRFGIAALEVRNLFDEDVHFQDTSFQIPAQQRVPNPRFSVGRTIMGRLTLSF